MARLCGLRDELPEPGAHLNAGRSFKIIKKCWEIVFILKNLYLKKRILLDFLDGNASAIGHLAHTSKTADFFYENNH